MFLLFCIFAPQTHDVFMEVSVFRNFWDKEPRGSTLEAMVEAIRTDERTRELTSGYRRQRLDALKNESMLFAVPCVFEGGKAQKHVVRLTGLSLVDFDHVDPSPDPSPAGAGNGCADMRQKIVSDPHTLLCYTTISGEGLRVLFRYELDEGFELKQQMQFYKKAFAVGNAYYERLTGAVSHCKGTNYFAYRKDSFQIMKYTNEHAVTAGIYLLPFRS